MPPLPQTDRKASHSGRPACITPIHDAVTTAVLNLMDGEVILSEEAQMSPVSPIPPSEEEYRKGNSVRFLSVLIETFIR